MEKIILRADGNEGIGLGHVYRLLALAEKLSSICAFQFYIRKPSADTSALIKNFGIEIIELPDNPSYQEEGTELAKEITSTTIVVLDGYHFDSNYQLQLKSTGCQLLVIDDIHAFHYHADYLFNFGAENLEHLYKTAFYTKTYFGFQYALFRKEFVNYYKQKKQVINNNDNAVFVNFGAADLENYTEKIIDDCLQHQPNRLYHVVIGNQNSRAATLIEKFKSSSNVNIQINLSADLLLKTMAECQSAICSASTIAYEFLFVGSRLFILKTADNQELVYTNLLNKGIAKPYSDFFKAESDLHFNDLNRQSLLEANINFSYPKLFGKIIELSKLSLRKATIHDCKLLFDWANDPVTRSQSFSTTKINWEDHVKWFEERVHSTNHLFLILMHTTEPVGQLRFDFKQGEAIINYSIGPNHRGKGFGSELIKLATLELLRIMPQVIIVGQVKADNWASRKAFLANNYSENALSNSNACDFEYKFIND